MSLREKFHKVSKFYKVSKHLICVIVMLNRINSKVELIMQQMSVEVG